MQNVERFNKQRLRQPILGTAAIWKPAGPVEVRAGSILHALARDTSRKSVPGEIPDCCMDYLGGQLHRLFTLVTAKLRVLGLNTLSESSMALRYNKCKPVV